MEVRHVMHLTTTHASGEEEWLCPTCGRRFLMHWPPAYKKVVIEPGDEAAFHSGSKGSLSEIISISMSQDTDVTSGDYLHDRPRTSYSGPTSLEEATTTQPAEELRPWLKWLATANLDEHLGEAP